MHIFRIRTSALALMIAALLLVLLATACAEDEGKGTVVLIEQDWDGQTVTTALLGLILEEEMGYTVEKKFAPADSQQMFQGLATGEMDIACCNWPSFSASLLHEFVEDDKSVESVGPNGILGTSHWYMPRYVREGDADRDIDAVAPDLFGYADMNQYKDVFATADTAPMGRLIDHTPAWDYRNQERLEAFGVDFEVHYAGSETAAFAELDAAFKRGEPVMIVIWTPHWSIAKYDLVPIELPDWETGCYEAGMDVSTARFDCGFPIDPVAKLADPDLKDDMPEVYEFLTNVTMTNAQQEEMVLAKVEGGLTDDEVAREWMDANESVWEAWIP